MYVETQEIYQLAGAVYLGLVNAFALPEHGSAVHQVAVLGGDEISGTQKNIGPVLPTHIGPRFPSRQCGFNGLVYVLFFSVVKMPQVMRPFVRRIKRNGIPRSYFFTADVHRY